jgi:hypothetical protein
MGGMGMGMKQKEEKSVHVGNLDLSSPILGNRSNNALRILL